jgi:lysophospholipase L1-like esterase
MRSRRPHSLSSRPAVGAVAALAAAAAVLLAGCGGADEPSALDAGHREPAAPAAASPAATPSSTAVPAAVTPADEVDVYVAVGASETVGVGADRPASQAWPHVLQRRELADARYVNLGVSGSTVGQALTEQLPQALAAEPDLVTVWLAVNDITHGVQVQTYEQQLRTLVHALRRGGATEVLVGNVPAVQDLPAYRACLPGATTDVECLLPVVPPKALVAATVRSFNAAVDRVVTAEGARLVDLSARQDLTRLTGDDGFHPSTRGHRLVAATFATALER